MLDIVAIVIWYMLLAILEEKSHILFHIINWMHKSKNVGIF